MITCESSMGSDPAADQEELGIQGISRSIVPVNLEY
jgi:hypothetical protein